MEGVLSADGRMYTAVEGYRTEQLQKNIGKEVEVKGTVKEAEGKVTIDVTSYELTPSGEREDTLGSCKEWLNCNQTSPNYTGACCRQCEDEQGEKLWDCKVFSEGEHFDLIVCDIEMPVVNGFEFAEMLRRDPRLGATPIIALSALCTPAAIERGRQSGFDDFVAKFDRPGLIAALKECTGTSLGIAA